MGREFRKCREGFRIEYHDLQHLETSRGGDRDKAAHCEATKEQKAGGIILRAPPGLPLAWSCPGLHFEIQNHGTWH